MSQLADLQRRFADALSDPQAGVPDGIIGPTGAAAPKRFNVYRNNVIVSLSEALAVTYPAVARLLGEEYFRALAPVFVRAHPPTSPVLMFYGEVFAEFLASFEPLADYPYLSDVARIEWAWLQAYHAADADPLAPEALAGIAPEALSDTRFVPHPAAAVLRSAHPSLTIFKINRDANCDDDAGNTNSLAGNAGPEDTLVTRPELDVEVRRLPAGGAAFLDALVAGASLGEAAGLAEEATRAADQTFDLSVNIRGMLEAGAFQAIA